MADPNKPMVELGIEFVVELLLFLYPYGADQMNLPHNFWLGLGCWVVGTAIAIRMFWIFPIWTHRLTKLEKALIASILVALFVAGLYGPVVTAYGRRNAEASLKEQPSINKQAEKPKELEQQPETKPIPAAKPPKRPSLVQSIPLTVPLLGSVQQNDSGGINVQQATTGENSPIIASPITINPPVNPNKRTTIYDCIGSWKSIGPSADTLMAVYTCLPDKCEKIKVFNDLMELNNGAAKERDSTGKADKFQDLRTRCEQEIKTTPEWLTPYLFCGLADVGIGDLEKLKTTLAYYDQHTGPTYDVGQCKAMSQYLHGALGN